MLDPERCSDMAGLFDPDYDGRYAHLLGWDPDLIAGRAGHPWGA